MAETSGLLESRERALWVSTYHISLLTSNICGGGGRPPLGSDMRDIEAHTPAFPQRLETAGLDSAEMNEDLAACPDYQAL